MKTTIHFYFFDLTVAAQKAEYAALCERLAGHPRKFDAMGFGDTGLKDGDVVDLDCGHLFDNQWNTVGNNGRAGVRLFDWREMAHASTKSGGMTNQIAPWYVRRGYWLEQTDEMREARRNTCTCRYCGRQEPAAKGYVFCPHCMGSEYLKRENLALTRLVPVCDSSEDVIALTETEKAVVYELYSAAQLSASLHRETPKDEAAKILAEAEAEYKKSVEIAERKLAGVRWFIDNKVNTYNVIYYSHVDAWCFGWRSELDNDLADAVELTLKENAAPFNWIIKAENGTRKSA